METKKWLIGPFTWLERTCGEEKGHFQLLNKLIKNCEKYVFFSLAKIGFIMSDEKNRFIEDVEQKKF